MSQDIIQFELHVDRGIAIDCNVDRSRQFGGIINQLVVTNLSINQTQPRTMHIDQGKAFSEVEL